MRTVSGSSCALARSLSLAGTEIDPCAIERMCLVDARTVPGSLRAVDDVCAAEVRRVVFPTGLGYSELLGREMTTACVCTRIIPS